MTALNWRLAALVLLLGLALGGRVAWLWQANSYDRQLAVQAEGFAQERERAAGAATTQLQSQQTQREALEQRLQTHSQTHYKEMKRAQDDRQGLRDRLATADLRLSVLIDNAAVAQGGDCGVPACAGAGRVVHGPARVQLDPAHAQRIVAITGDGDNGLRALQACQAYVSTIMESDKLNR